MRHVILTAVLILLAPATLTRQGLAPTADAAATDTGSSPGPSIGQFIKIKWPGSGHLAPDGKYYYTFNPQGVRQLFRAASDAKSAGAKQLTHFEDGIISYRLSDDGRHIAITAATGGSEQADLYLLDTANDELTELLVNPKVVFGSVVWRRDSAAFAYRANADSPADFHVYLYDLQAKTHKPVFQAAGYHYPTDFNRDGSKLLIGKYNSASYSQLFELDLTTGQSREITPANEQWSFGPVGYSATDRHVVVATNYRQDLTTLHTIDLRTGDIKPILPQLRKFQLDDATFNDDRSILAVTVNQDGYSNLRLFRASDLAPLKLPQLPKGIVYNVDFTGSKMLYAVNNANTPGLVYQWDLNKPSQSAVCMGQADTQGIDVTAFRLPELVHYPSFDGTSIPAFLYLPADYKKGTQIPFIVQYHGGPEGQYRPYFNRAFQYFLSRGYGIIAPNVRGSDGYGKEYLEADNYKNRYKSVRDGVWAAKYVIDRGYAVKGGVGAWGGSYGGFMAMAVITEAPDLFGAACNVVGICNFETFLKQTKAYRRRLREAEYGPLTDPEFLRSISPIYNVDKIRTPLMLAHGLNDPRVPFGEALQVAIALIKKGQTVEQLYFPDEGHGFAKEENRLLYYEHLARFFQTHLAM
ncbi:MAG: prolyl oligopeptidase family serine peptidase [Phycisphaerae bacterium]